jgi:hypothetical protein
LHNALQQMRKFPRGACSLILLISSCLPAIAAGQETEAPVSRLRGRVLERGSIDANPIAGAKITTSTGIEVNADEKGRFELALPAGKIELVIGDDLHEPLRVTEDLPAGQGLSVEYRLTPKSARTRYESTVRGEARHEGERFTLRDEELRQAPGTLGDPFRVIGLLPGEAPRMT